MSRGPRRWHRAGRTPAVVLAVLAVLATLAAYGHRPASAAARGGRVEAVSGGGGFADAQLLHPGIFADTLLPRETLFYAVRLHEGERMRVRATVDLRPGSQTAAGAKAFGGFALRVYSPLRQALTLEHQLTTAITDLETDHDAWETPRVVSFAQAMREAAEGDPWRGPGLYHVTAAVSAIFDDVGAVVEYPLRLQVDVDDRGAAPADTAGAGPLDAPADAGRPIGAGAHRAARRAVSGGASGPATAAAAAGGLLLGLLLALGAVAAFGRRPARSPPVG
jgi:hypothetical protein